MIECSHCQGRLTASGLCLRCHRRTTSEPVRQPAQPDEGWRGKAPDPSPLDSPPVPVRPTPGAAGDARSAPVPLSPQGPEAPTPGAFGATVIRGTVTDLGEQRMESVGMQGSQALQQLSTGCLLAPFRALAIALGLLLAPLRGLLAVGLMPGRQPQTPDRLQVPGTPFVVTDAGGTAYECYLRGEVRGGFIRLGDEVQVRGRLDPRTATLRVRDLTNVRTGAIARGYVDPDARMAPMRNVLAVVLAFALLCLILGMLGVI